MLIIKTHRLNSKFENLVKIPIGEDVSVEKMISVTLTPENNNQFTTLLPLKDEATARTTEFLDFSAPVQPVVFEFDYDTLEHQEERAKEVARKIPTPAQVIFSGNKSLHMVLWFKNFAGNAEDYKKTCFWFYKYLSTELPEWFEFLPKPTAKLEPQDCQLLEENKTNIPDTSLFTANKYYRQADGIRDNGKEQTCTILNSVEKYKPVEINDFTEEVAPLQVEHKPTKNPDDFYQEIKEKVLIRVLIEKELKGSHFINGYVSPCPVCSHNDCFNIDNSGQKWYCFSDAHGSGGSVLDLVVQTKKSSNVKEAAIWLAEKFSVEVPASFKKKKKPPTFNPLVETEKFLKNHQFFLKEEQLFWYQNGVYQATEDGNVKNKIAECLAPYNSRGYLTREVIDALKSKLSDPAWVRNLEQTDYLNLQNGLLDYETLTLHKHSPKYHSSYRINSKYDSKATCPEFMKFLVQIFRGDQSLITVVQEFMGYCLTPETYLQKVLFFKGPGSDGKSVLCSVFELLLEGHVSHVQRESLETNRFAAADLSNKLLNVSSELTAHRHFNIEIFKQLTGEDTVKAERKFKDAFDFIPVAKHIITCNHLPFTYDLSDAFFRRIDVVPFKVQFKTKAELTNLSEEDRKNCCERIPKLILMKMLAKERDGILNFALEGLRRLKKQQELSYSPAIENENTALRIRSQSVKIFIDEKTEKKGKTKLKELYGAYEKYCSIYDVPVVKYQKFGAALRDQAYEVDTGTGNYTYVDPIRLKKYVKQPKSSKIVSKVRQPFTLSNTERGKKKGSTKNNKSEKVPNLPNYSYQNPEHPKKYQLVDTPVKLTRLVQKLEKAKLIAVDTETTSKEPMLAELVGIRFAVDPDEAFYVPVQAPDQGKLIAGFGGDPLLIVRKALNPVLANGKILKCGHNFKYDWVVLRNHGFNVKGFSFDTMIAEHLLLGGAQGKGDLKMDTLSSKYLNYLPISIKDLIGEGKETRTMDNVQLEEVCPYACEDADITLQLTEFLKPRLDDADLLKYHNKIEIPIVETLVEMELNGVFVDQERLEKIKQALAAQIPVLKHDIYDLAGVEFNVNSSQQLSEILFDRLKLPVVKPTEKGARSTNCEVLEKLALQHPLPKAVLKLRKKEKLVTYSEALLEKVNPKTGRVHPEFNQTVAATGRLSTSKPNFQSLPKTAGPSVNLRGVIRSEFPGGKIISADYSQIEVRVMAELAEETTLIKALKGGEDIHTTVAAGMFGPEFENASKIEKKEMRSKAKIATFGIMYGGGPKNLADIFGLTMGEAKEFISRYFERFPGVNLYNKNSISFAKKEGFIKTSLGRQRTLSGIYSSEFKEEKSAERKAINTPIQGTAAEIIKLAMVRVLQELKCRNLKTKMILQIHDELVFDAPLEEVEEVMGFVETEMIAAGGVVLKEVPCVVTAEVADSWAEAH